jgi:hypothetical protein
MVDCYLTDLEAASRLLGHLSTTDLEIGGSELLAVQVMVDNAHDQNRGLLQPGKGGGGSHKRLIGQPPGRAIVYVKLRPSPFNCRPGSPLGGFSFVGRPAASRSRSFSYPRFFAFRNLRNARPAPGRLP